MALSERQLEELAQRLGSEASQRLDVDVTAATVIKRLKTEPAVDGGVWRSQSPIWGALAAAAAAVLALVVLSGGPNDDLMSAVELARAPVELDVLSVDELQEVFDSLFFEAPVSELTVASLDDMNVGQLEELLETLMED